MTQMIVTGPPIKIIKKVHKIAIQGSSRVKITIAMQKILIYKSTSTANDTGSFN